MRADLLRAGTDLLCPGTELLRSLWFVLPSRSVRSPEGETGLLLQVELLRIELLRSGTDLLCPGTELLRSRTELLRSGTVVLRTVLQEALLPEALVPPLLQAELLRTDLLRSGTDLLRLIADSGPVPLKRKNRLPLGKRFFNFLTPQSLAD